MFKRNIRLCVVQVQDIFFHHIKVFPGVFLNPQLAIKYVFAKLPQGVYSTSMMHHDPV